MNSRRSAGLTLGATIALVFPSSLPAATNPASTTPDPTAPKATPPRATPPKATAPKATAPKATPPKATPPKAPTPKATPPKATPPKATAPKKTTTQPAVAQGVAYVGDTSQKASNISLLLTKDRKRIKTLDIQWSASASQCTSGLPYVSSAKFGRPIGTTLPLSLTGAFKATNPLDVSVPGVAELTETPTITGKVGPNGASGTFRATVLLKDATGKEVNRCDTGRITWTADQ
jgi:hypothetical protein